MPQVMAKFGSEGMHQALAELGRRCEKDTEVVIVGGAAAVLCHWLSRTTGDIDVVDADPRLATLSSAIREVAEDLGLPANWLNDSAKGFADVLPPDYRDRLSLVGQFGALRVLTVSRQDFILLKLFAFRDTDFEDLQALQPTLEEVTFVRGQLERLAKFDDKKAHYIEMYLDQGAH